LEFRIAPSAYVFAVAHGFGELEGFEPARLAIRRLRAEFEGYGSRERLRRCRLRPKAVTANLIGTLARVNGYLHVRTA